ncbi:MAG: hypothetical protein HZB53_07740 [Chloroflexi bacterium]|nr:hypothetical protein [Chloroflexota bacterium]
MSRRIVPVAVMVGAGLVTLLGQFTDALLLGELSRTFVQWAGILFAFALMLGLWNLLAVHLRRVRAREAGWPDSLVLIGTAFVVLCAGLNGVSAPSLQWIFQHVQAPLESAMLALLVFFMGGAVVRALRARGRGVAFMLLTAAIVLLGQLPLMERFGREFADARAWIISVPMTAGMRGIVLGVALGTLATGLRLLSGVEHDRLFNQ